MSEVDDIGQRDQEVRRWGKETLDQLKGMSVRRSGLLVRMLKSRFRSRGGHIDAVGFIMPRYAVWMEKGASRGHGGAKGSRWWDGSGWRRTDPRSLGKMNMGRRRARPVINPVLDRRVPVLADIVARFWADATVNAIKIR